MEAQKIEELNVFNSVEYLEPKCPKCGIKIDYGISTTWSDKRQAHTCNKCGMVLR